MNHFGRIDVQSIDITVHADEQTPLYGNRQFAVGQTTWIDKNGKRHLFEERWVKNVRTWFTRSTGLVTPAVAD
jgi:hypothetical protein